MKVSFDCAPPRGRMPGALAPGLFAAFAVLLVVVIGPSSSSTAAVGEHGTGSRAHDPTPRWSWPVPLPHDVVRDFEAPAEKWSPGHRGIDVSAGPAAVVLAPDSGVVHFAGVVVDRPVLSLAHDGGVLSSFEPVVATVARGDPIQRGQPIGVLQPGHCSADTCLHLGARIDGEYVSPLLLLGDVRRAVLLPTRR
ncbi:hypothetical protein GCM10025867_34060 [Frondihabitans sucicola]|uniref:M23ase beta-sheet core domain-containing protein n=1 Tax=Frondihabitans sucicola TaxID=1268041 RepID=A0ABN6Y5I7_9MICO|nr:peptidoglycan DD-metalloendopeptidase family protein [Frondihabitans sucicola]BDZ51165.1 hypothetical protein GCM10025867_34060 [Frondihabitans sucicola]